jgi:hypothetical protein
MSNPESSLHEIRAARDHAEFLRDQLQSEYDRLVDEEELLEMIQPDAEQREAGLDKMRQAIQAADHAIASIDQFLSGMERVKDEPN